jgi:hypothetical protein
MPKFICETQDCGEVISEGTGSHGGLPICKKCRASQYYWEKKGPKAREIRREQLSFWTGRLDYLSAHVRKTLKDSRQRIDAARHRAHQHLHH